LAVAVPPGEAGRGGGYSPHHSGLTPCSTSISKVFSDFQGFLGLPEKHNVEYVIVGGYAVGVHGFPRYTGDMDVFVGINGENAGRLVDVFREFGFASLGLKASDLLEPDTVVEVGREPMKIQVLTGIDGVTFDRCLSDRIMVNLSGLQVPFIGFESLLANKAASPRSKDRIDLEELTRLRDLQKKREIEREIE
jgi:predicted nucleotidyltransferase